MREDGKESTDNAKLLLWFGALPGGVSSVLIQLHLVWRAAPTALLTGESWWGLGPGLCQASPHKVALPPCSPSVSTLSLG